MNIPLNKRTIALLAEDIIKPQLQVRIPFERDKCPDTIVYSNIIVESFHSWSPINEPGPRRSAGLRCNKRATDQLFGQVALTFRQRKYMGISDTDIKKRYVYHCAPRINELLYGIIMVSEFDLCYHGYLSMRWIFSLFIEYYIIYEIDNCDHRLIIKYDSLIFIS